MKHHPLVNRHEHIRKELNRFELLGIVKDVSVGHSRPGLKWFFTPNGYSERALTTSQVEDFILGANAAIGVYQSRAQS